MPSTGEQDTNLELNTSLNPNAGDTTPQQTMKAPAVTPASTVPAPQGVPMISPDRTDTRIVPADQQADAASAGWEHASKMVHPQTQDKRWVPASQMSDAAKAGYVKTDVPAASTESHPFQGLGSAAKDMAVGAITPAPVQNVREIYNSITEDMPATIRAYEAVRSAGGSRLDAVKAADAKAREINDAKNQLMASVKEFNTNPNKAAWQTVLQLGTIALGGEVAAKLGPETLEPGALANAPETVAEGVTPEAAQEAEAAGVPKPGIIKQVLKGGKVAQQPAQTALRTAAQKATPALSKMQEVDQFPVKLVYDDEGNVVDLDGRHRVMQAIDEGKETMPVQTKLRDGSIQTLNVAPKDIAEKFGVTKESLAATDEGQTYRAPSGQPRPTAVKESVATSATPTTTELRESLTAPIEAAEKNADALYKPIDDAAGTDFKGLSKKLRDTNFKIRMSTNPTDEAAWEAKRTEIEDTIADAKQRAAEAGVPDDQLAKADAQFKKMSALTDIEKKVFKNVNVVHPTTGEVNIDSAVKELQKLQDNTKYGSPRLEQAFGKDNTLLEDMKAANRLGIKAPKRQNLAKGLLKYGLGGAAGLEILHKVVE